MPNISSLAALEVTEKFVVVEVVVVVGGFQVNTPTLVALELF